MGQRLTECKRAIDTDEYPNARPLQTCPHDHEHNIGTCGAEGYADADFLPALFHPTAHQPVETEGRQGQGYNRKRSDQLRLETPGPIKLLELLLDRRDIEVRHRRVHGSHSPPYPTGQV